MIRITLVSNAIQLEAARRLRRAGLARRRRQTPDAEPSRLPADAVGTAAPEPWLELLVHEPTRMQLTAEDHRLWPLRARISAPLMAALTLPALLGLVAELRLAHLYDAGRALRRLARHARRLCLLDDGLDQYRERPRAVDPQAFPEGTPYWLFSDAQVFRADWCGRFSCRDLGPLYGGPDSGAEVASAAAPIPTAAVLLIDAPGLERLALCPERLPSPRLLVAHPVQTKRRWTVPAGPDDLPCSGPPEPLIAAFPALVVVGESMTLLAAVRLRPPGSPLLVCLPEAVDANLSRLVRGLAAGDPAIRVV